MEIGKLSNPFATWIEPTRGLRARFESELDSINRSADARDILIELAGVIKRCEHMGVLLERLRRNDPQGFDAFVRALEQS